MGISTDLALEATLLLENLQNRDDWEAASPLSTVRVPSPLDELDLTLLPRIPLREKTPETVLLELRGELGRGGMGAVHLARQNTLLRDVAIKSLLPEFAEPTHIQMLLREAQIMGYLQHPAIVPVHLVGCDESGSPFVVMKRLEGDTLLDRLTGADLMANLESNLDVFLGVCQALSYAHSRGIIHRDIKPANVMTGSFGEVYLLDWGIAVAYRDDVPPQIPRPETGHLVGTPAFMAPEMASREGPFGPHTDIYLLGALLHSILTGTPPHMVGEASPLAILFAAYQSEPKTFPQHVPEALAAICNRAMARKPEDRFESVEQLRQAILDYRQHRDAQEMAARGIAQTAELRRVLTQNDPDDATVQRLFGVARQSLEDARRIWPTCPAATPSLQEALELMIEFELSRDDPRSAQRFVRELPAENLELAARVEAALSRLSRTRTTLAALQRDSDPRVARRQRGLMFIGIGAAAGLPLVVPHLVGMEVTARDAVLGQGLVIVAYGVLTLTLRRPLLSTRMNRALVTGVWLPILMDMMLRLGTLAGAVPFWFTCSAGLAFASMIAAYLAFNFDPRLRVVVPGYLLGAAATLFLREHAMFLFGLTHWISLTLLGAQHLLIGRGDPPADG